MENFEEKLNLKKNEEEKLNLKKMREIRKIFSIVLYFMFCYNVYSSIHYKNIGFGLISVLILVIQVIDYLEVSDDQNISELEEKYISKDVPSENDINTMTEKMKKRYEETEVYYRILTAFIIFLKVLVVSIPIVMYFR